MGSPPGATAVGEEGARHAFRLLGRTAGWFGDIEPDPTLLEEVVSEVRGRPPGCRRPSQNRARRS
jgi:hypothetical protein